MNINYRSPYLIIITLWAIILTLTTIKIPTIAKSHKIEPWCTEEYKQVAYAEEYIELCTQHITKNSQLSDKKELERIRLKKEQTELSKKNESLRKLRDEKASSINEIIKQDKVAFQ